jgi:hypothetical protein
MVGVTVVFPNVEYRECVVHLVSNFKRGIMGRYSIRTCGLLHILGIHTILTSIGMQWVKLNLLQ